MKSNDILMLIAGGLLAWFFLRKQAPAGTKPDSIETTKLPAPMHISGVAPPVPAHTCNYHL